MKGTIQLCAIRGKNAVGSNGPEHRHPLYTFIPDIPALVGKLDMQGHRLCHRCFGGAQQV